MNMDGEYSGAKAAAVIIQLEHFKKDASMELGINWGQIVILANLASPDVSFLSSPEIILKTGMDRCWVYRNLRKLLLKGLIDSLKQPSSTHNQVRALYSINGKGSFYLTHALRPNGIRMIKAFEGRG